MTRHDFFWEIAVAFGVVFDGLLDGHDDTFPFMEGSNDSYDLDSLPLPIANA